MNIELHIERLVLDGLSLEPGQGVHIQAAVEAELTRLLGEQGISPRLQAGGALPSVRADPMQLTPGSLPAQVGTQIARSVYSGIGSGR